MRRWMLFSSVLWALGCHSGEIPGGGIADLTVPEVGHACMPTPSDPVSPVESAVGCAPNQLAFFDGPMGWTGGEHGLHISPNGAVAARWSTHGWEDRAFVKLTTGQTLATMPHDWHGALDGRWHLRARVFRGHSREG